MPEFTLNRGYPYPLGDERVDVAGDIQRLAEAIDADDTLGGASAGVIQMTIAATPDTGWLFLQGQAIVGANVLYPSLWSRAPAGWKSGTTLTFPDARQKFPGGFQSDGAAPFNVLGSTGSQNARLITEGQLPAHHHGLNNHQHRVNSNTADASVSHSHGVDHSHSVGVGGSGLTGAGGAHNHGDPPWNSVGFLYNDVGTEAGRLADVTGGGIRLATWAPALDHQHSVTVNPTSGLSTQPHPITHKHSVDITSDASLTANTTDTGLGQQFSVVPATFVVNFQIKAH